MKFSTSVVLALAPLAMARRVRNAYPANPVRRAPEMQLADRELARLHGMRGAGLGARNGHKDDDSSDDSSDDNKDDNNDDNNDDGGNQVNVSSNTEIIIIWANPGNNAATTTVNEKVTVTQTVTAGGEATDSVAAAATHTVTVGGPAGLVYTPDQLNDVPVGDMVVFEFLQQNHTVTQSGFDTPCVAMAEGMDSGFMANPNSTVSPPPQVAMQVMVDTPLWFYCKQGDHCGQGMVFSVNPAANKTQAQFQQAAIAQNGTGTESPITGGSTTSAAAAEDTAAATETAAATSVATDAAQATDGVSPGTGTVGADGSCSCFVSCSAGSFPAADVQGLGARGGIAGSLPMNMVGVS